MCEALGSIPAPKKKKGILYIPFKEKNRQM
jgi:hypothetical protein